MPFGQEERVFKRDNSEQQTKGIAETMESALTSHPFSDALIFTYSSPAQAHEFVDSYLFLLGLFSF